MNLGVITTCYGHAEYLRESLASIAIQSSDRTCHVLVSDGDDESLRLMLEHKHQHRGLQIIVIGRADRGGPAAAWNTGIQNLPPGIDWCMKHDADDVAHPSLIPDVFLAAQQWSNVDIIVPPCEVIWNSNRRLYRFPDYSRKAHLNEGCIPAQAAFRREFFDLVGGFDETMPSAEDWDFFVRLGTVRKLQVIQLEHPRWYYRQHDGQRASGAIRRHLGAYREYFRGHTAETVKNRSRTWAQFCEELRHGGAPWIHAKETAVA